MENPQFTQLSLTVEEWRQIPGYEGWYSVSSLGRVRRDAPPPGRRTNTWPGRITKPQGRKRQPCYLVVRLSKNGILRSHGVHVLVAKAFLGPCPEGKEINHKNGIKADNRADNLEYLTHSENINHGVQIGLINHATYGNGKLEPDQIRKIRLRHAAGDVTFVALAAEYGVSAPTIRAIVLRTSWKHI